MIMLLGTQNMRLGETIAELNLVPRERSSHVWTSTRMHMLNGTCKTCTGKHALAHTYIRTHALTDRLLVDVFARLLSSLPLPRFKQSAEGCELAGLAFGRRRRGRHVLLRDGAVDLHVLRQSAPIRFTVCNKDKAVRKLPVVTIHYTPGCSTEGCIVQNEVHYFDPDFDLYLLFGMWDYARLNLKFRQYPVMHTNRMLYHCTTLKL